MFDPSLLYYRSRSPRESPSMNKEERKHVKAVGSMDSAENAGALRSQRESLAESQEEEEMA